MTASDFLWDALEVLWCVVRQKVPHPLQSKTAPHPSDGEDAIPGGTDAVYNALPRKVPLGLIESEVPFPLTWLALRGGLLAGCPGGGGTRPDRTAGLP